MFFMMGITPGQRELASDQLAVCDACRAYGRYRVYMTYTVLTLFFIPVLKWNRQYYVQMSCCGTVYRLNPEVGQRIALGERVEILPSDLERVGGYEVRNPVRRCRNCGYTTEEDFEYCPKCGTRF